MRCSWLARRFVSTRLVRYPPVRIPLQPLRRSWLATASGDSSDKNGNKLDKDADEDIKKNVDLLGMFDEMAETWAEKEETPKERKERLETEAFHKRLEALTALPEDLIVANAKDTCPGCGCLLQDVWEDRPGFVPTSVWEKYRFDVKRAKEDEEKRAAQVEEMKSNGAVSGEVNGEVVSGEEQENRQDQEQADAPKLVQMPKPLICKRCFRLSNYGSIPDSLRVMDPRASSVVISEPSEVKTEDKLDEKILTPATFRKILSQLQSRLSVIVYLVDVFDFHGTFLQNLRDFVGTKSQVILALNKVDLLPDDYKEDRVKRWARQEARDLGLTNLYGVHLISSTKGTGVKTLLSDAVDLAKRYKCDVYVVGAANVGKSSFINRIMTLKSLGGKKKQTKAPWKKKGRDFPGGRTDLLTTSVIPGTTLDTIRIPLMSRPKMSLYDTPGLILSHQLTNLLTAEELRAVLPAKSICNVTFRLGEGKSLYLGGLARIDVVEGRPFFFSAYVSSEVKVHPGRSEYTGKFQAESEDNKEGADDFTRRHIGKLLAPPFSEERYDTLGKWVSKSCLVNGAGWKEAAIDVVFSGLGWVSITGVGSLKIRICVPKGVGVFTREALMPYEVRQGAAYYTGSGAVNKRKETRAQRQRKRNRERLEDSYIPDW